MFFKRQSIQELETELAFVEQEISEHPLNSEPVKQAQVISEKYDSDHKELAEQELALLGLPSLEELGKIYVKNTGSWWKLHQQKNKIVRKIKKLIV